MGTRHRKAALRSESGREGRKVTCSGLATLDLVRFSLVSFN